MGQHKENKIHSAPDLWRAMAYGFLGVACFSLTTPFTKLALESFSPYFIAIGRVALAGVLAAVILWRKKEKWPDKSLWKKLIFVSLGVSVGFPLCLSFALARTEASHAGIVLSILPLLTSILAASINKEKHSFIFWLMALSGCSTVLIYILWRNGIALTAADGWLLAAALSAAVAYSIGAQLSKQIGGLNTICWALIFILPISLPTGFYLLWHFEPHPIISFSSMAAFIYLALVSQLLGFVPWYTGLRMGGIARVSQIQLLQTFLTLCASAWFLGEHIHWYDWGVAMFIMLQVYLIKKFS